MTYEQSAKCEGQGWFSGLWLEQMTFDKEHVGRVRDGIYYILEHAVCKMPVGYWHGLIRDTKT